MTEISRFDGEHRWLSNFWPTPIKVNGRVWPTVEHAYQAAKTKCPHMRGIIWMARTPGEAKRRGGMAVLRPDWDAVKVDGMFELLRAKFGQHKDLAAKLLATGDAKLIEGNKWHDNFWGVCSCARCAVRSEGALNMLGRLLMRVRAELEEGVGV